MDDRQDIVHNLLQPEREVHIAIAGKYTALDDSYISVVESLKHA
jgi:CTP synthase